MALHDPRAHSVPGGFAVLLVNKDRDILKLETFPLFCILPTGIRLCTRWVLKLYLLYEQKLPWWFSGKESACNVEDAGSNRELGRSPRGGNGNPLPYSCLGNLTDRGVWWATVRGVAESDTT